MQFLVMLYDGTDAEAPARRAATRPAHLEGIKGNVANGKLLFGGPLFNDAQKPTGSFLLVECADRAELDAIIANDPYTKGNVWQKVEVKPTRLVVRNGTITP
ncbi:MAG TPA: YciI family protein [Acetobacteraceae bacterium]|nr:YciI family protein [Acetobacteraceae bacterium]